MAVARCWSAPTCCPIASLAGMALAQGPVGLFAQPGADGRGHGVSLYEAAFATLVRLYGQGAQRHHRHHADCRFCQHGGLATVGVDGSAMGLARRVRAGGIAPAGGGAAERLAATRPAC